MRRFLVPEVVQTTAVDCGPAALKILLGGFGISAGYERLREACHTGVDGTSIDDVEEAARALGLDAEQGVLPLDHLLLDDADALPAIVVTRTATRFTHFVVAWRKVGGWVQIGDPAVGRRWVRARAFEREVLEHTIALPASDLRAWASRDGFLRPLRARMRRLGVARVDALVGEALADPSWRGVVALDAAVRAVSGLVRDGGIDVGAGAKLVRALFERVRGESEGSTSVVPPACWIARSAGADDGEEHVLVRGAVTVHVRGTRSREDDEPLPRELAAAVAEKPIEAGRELLGLAVHAAGVASVALLAAGAACVALAATVQGWLIGSLVTAPTAAGATRLGAALGASAIVGWLALWRARVVGARIESALWRRLVAKIPRLEDAYFQSRPMSDLALRAHGVEVVRDAPWIAVEIAAASIAIAAITASIAWVDPRSAFVAVLLALASIAVPMMTRAWLVERDLREGAHDSAMGRVLFEALRGLVPLRAHGGDLAFRLEAVQRRAAWTRAVRSRAWAAACAEVASGLAAIALTGVLLVASGHHSLASDARAAVALWALVLPWIGLRLAASMRAWGAVGGAFVRLVEPLNAPEAKRAAEAPASGRANAGSGVAITLRGVSIRAAGRTILDGIDLDVRPGEHVAIVGRSGAGKSSLAGILLGWHEPFEGEALVDGSVLDASACAALRRETAWVDPAVQLWDRSLRENVLYGEHDDAPLDEAIDHADLARLVARWPEGLATTLGEAGGRVSGGEGERVRLARAFARRGVRLAILDEAFRGLEREERRALLARARKLWHGATLLCITHDVRETLALDRVIVLEGGRIVEDGVPRDLAAGGTRYRALLDAEDVLTRELEAWRHARLEGGVVHEASEGVAAPRVAQAEALPELASVALLPSWPEERAADAIAALARVRGWPTLDSPFAPASREDAARVACAQGLDAEPIAIAYADFESIARRGAFLLRDPSGQLVVLSDGALVTPDGRLSRMLPKALRSAFFGQAEAALAPAIDGLLDAAGAEGSGRARMREAFLARAIATPIESCLRLRAASRPWRLSPMLAVVPLSLAAACALFASWVLVGGAVLADVAGWVSPWLTLRLYALVAGAMAIVITGLASSAIGAGFRRARLDDALDADVDALRADGIGRHVGRILAGGAREGYGFEAWAAGTDALAWLVVSVACFASVRMTLGIVVLLLGFVALVPLALAHLRALSSANDARVALAYEVVEEMSGQRTRVAQLAEERWHERDERSITIHDARSTRSDRARASLFALPSAWLGFGLLTVPAALIVDPHVPLAIGGVLMGAYALSRGARAALCATRARDAGVRARVPASTVAVPRVAARSPVAEASIPILEARDVGIDARGSPVLARCSLRIARGDRVLLEGASGSGKSTLAAILASLRAPSAGEARFLGQPSAAVDPRAWRRRVVLVPQFHDNHVFTESLAFNVLLGRSWPPREADLSDAEAVCRELELGDLLDRMPGGLEQMVGETGWQLSHGERSRVFVARALLQRSDVLLLDESVAALDPETLARVLRCITARAETVLLVAHP